MAFNFYILILVTVAVFKGMPSFYAKPEFPGFITQGKTMSNMQPPTSLTLVVAPLPPIQGHISFLHVQL